MGKHRSEPIDGLGMGRNTTIAIGVVGALAIALVFGAWWMLSAGPSIAKGATAMTTARVTLDQAGNPTGASAGATEAFVVPTPSFVTPSLGIPLGSREPEIPGETATMTIPARTTTPSSSSSSSSSPSGAVTVRNVSLVCSLQGHRVRATLTFTSTGRVPVTLTAGDRTETTNATGNVRLDVIGAPPAKGNATCSARVNGLAIGPVIAT